MNKYQRVISKMAKEDAKRFNISFYSAKKCVLKMFNGFKKTPIEKTYRVRRLFSMSTKKIMIMGCTKKDAWYKNKIGKVYPVEEESTDSYYVTTKEQGGKFGIVSKKDAEVI
jgi:hypothetical protein